MTAASRGAGGHTRGEAAPRDATPPRIGSLFTGYGGLDMAAHSVLGGRLAWVCEHEPPTEKTPRPRNAAARLLAHRHPDVPNLGDISTVDWATVPPIDHLVGGFPCQDISVAGLNAGLASGTRSGLWAHMAAAIAALRPQLVLIENVGGLLSARAHSDLEPCPWCVGDAGGEPALRALGAVLGDLAGLGYDAVWTRLRAADVGAPHTRARVFILAWPAGDPDGIHREGWQAAGQQGQAGPAIGPTADADRNGREVVERIQPGLGARNDPDGRSPVAWGDYGPAIRRWERVLGRPAPSPTEPGRNGAGRLSPRFVEWMMGLPGGWVCDVPGVTRTDALKMLGNGVVPQQAAEALRRLLNLGGAQ